jgi:hypothetical protein
MGKRNRQVVEPQPQEHHTIVVQIAGPPSREGIKKETETTINIHAPNGIRSRCLSDIY